GRAEADAVRADFQTRHFRRLGARSLRRWLAGLLLFQCVDLLLKFLDLLLQDTNLVRRIVRRRPQPCANDNGDVQPDESSCQFHTPFQSGSRIANFGSARKFTVESRPNAAQTMV